MDNETREGGRIKCTSSMAEREREISCCDTQNEWISKTTNTIE
jgi:hypothetical protein